MHGEGVQHQTKDFYFMALKFVGLPDHDILIDYACIFDALHFFTIFTVYTLF